VASPDFQRVKAVFQEAVARSPESRGAYLDDACGDGELRREVERLLAAHEGAGAFLSTPAGMAFDLAEPRRK